jgi:hypothetical protein
VAVARVLRIDPDPAHAGHSYALMHDYQAFDRPVPLLSDGKYAEAPLRAAADPSKVGALLRGKSVRQLSDEDFADIVRAGLRETLAPENADAMVLISVITGNSCAASMYKPQSVSFNENDIRFLNRSLANRGSIQEIDWTDYVRTVSRHAVRAIIPQPVELSERLPGAWEGTL